MAVAAVGAWSSNARGPTARLKEAASGSALLVSSGLAPRWVFSVSSFGQPELDRLSGRSKRHRGDLRHRPLRP
jgi:hypothetical protein